MLEKKWQLNSSSYLHQRSNVTGQTVAPKIREKQAEKESNNLLEKNLISEPIMMKKIWIINDELQEVVVDKSDPVKFQKDPVLGDENSFFCEF